MALPVIPLPKSEVVAAEGVVVSFRSLTRKEALKVTQEFKGQADAAEVFILSCGLDTPEEEVAAWRVTTDPVAVGKVVDEIIYLSGLGTRPAVKDEKKPDEETDPKNS